MQRHMASIKRHDLHILSHKRRCNDVASPLMRRCINVDDVASTSIRHFNKRHELAGIVFYIIDRVCYFRVTECTFCFQKISL